MSDSDALDERLRAVERALTDDDNDLTDLRDSAELAREVETLSDRLDDLEDHVDELDAATQALRGYVGNVRAVNETVEGKADAALAKAEALESEGRASASDRPTPTERADASRATTAHESDHPCKCASRRTERPADADFAEEKTTAENPGLLARVVGRLADASGAE